MEQVSLRFRHWLKFHFSCCGKLTKPPRSTGLSLPKRPIHKSLTIVWSGKKQLLVQMAPRSALEALDGGIQCFLVISTLKLQPLPAITQAETPSMALPPSHRPLIMALIQPMGRPAGLPTCWRLVLAGLCSQLLSFIRHRNLLR
jgi:hypothetical protein